MEYPRSLDKYVKGLQKGGKNYTQIVVAMAVELGYALPIAHRIVESVIDHDGNDGLLFHSESPAHARVPDIDIGNRNSIQLSRITTKVVFEQIAPRIVLLENFLSSEECDAMCSIALPRMRDAKIFSPDSSSMISVKEIRDANSAFLPADFNPLVSEIDNRIAELTGWPARRGEALQVQRYAKDGKYSPHYDFFTGSMMSEMRDPKFQGQRLGTLIVYLRSPDLGGATYLTNLGLKISPRKGMALFFNYPEASKKSGTLHGGDPVLEGEKWILTKWFRERDWDSRNPSTPVEGEIP